MEHMDDVLKVAFAGDPSTEAPLFAGSLRRENGDDAASNSCRKPVTPITH